jgi:hypothetical protein
MVPDNNNNNDNNSHHNSTSLAEVDVVTNDDLSTAEVSREEDDVDAAPWLARNSHNRVWKWFLLGFSAALFLTTLATGTSIYFLCKDLVVVTFEDNSVNVCQSSSSQQQKRRGLSRFFQRKNEKEEECRASLSRDPKACACQWMWDSWQGYVAGFSGLGSSISSQAQQHSHKAPGPVLPRPKEDFPTAFTPEALPVSLEQEDIMKRYAQRAHDKIENWNDRVELVPWGGPDSMQHHNSTHTSWWAQPSTPNRKSTPLEGLEGGNLLFSYLRIMKWPTDLDTVFFPFKPCKRNGCPAEFALNHTLLFRERYQPWLVTPSVKKVNQNGAFYHRGFSPSHADDENAPHAIVWLRPALRVHVDEVFYARTLIRELEHAVASSMHRSGGRVGKFNAVISGHGFSLGVMPSLNGIKIFVTMLQDHYVDRLGVVVLTDMGRTCELLLKIFLPLIAEEVRNKIIVVPHHHEERIAILETILGKGNIPVWLGGTDTYEFDANEHYASKNVIAGTDEQAKEYLTTLPYHA